MQYRRLGRSNLSVSAVGFGTCQLRRVPEQQALDTLKRGFDLGVNLVHTAPDYEGADDLVAQAVEESGRHLLSYHPEPSRRYEDIPRNKTEIFPLAARHDVGLMIMKPLAGGLLCESKSFPPRAAFTAPPKLSAAEVLREILRHPEVSCV